MTHKNDNQNRLYRACIALAYSMPIGVTFTFGDLKEKSGIQCNINDQREAGRRFAWWIKYTPGIPFIIVGTHPLKYQRINPNMPPYNQKGDC